ncbi:MAG: hypothetical protein J6Z50_04570 [Fibrobacterales bacterium]|nr:hypothetical protein [Fibrobacterales bacterium]MBP5188386.1 hypothetical protein [Fibrobacterales bacterium]
MKRCKVNEKIPGAVHGRLFLWSAGFGGPLVAALAHSGALRRGPSKGIGTFFGTLALWVAALFLLERLIFALMKGLSAGWTAFFLLCATAIYLVVPARVAAERLAELAPRYAEAEFRRRERLGTAVGLFWYALQYGFAFWLETSPSAEFLRDGGRWFARDLLDLLLNLV